MKPKVKTKTKVLDELTKFHILKELSGLHKWLTELKWEEVAKR